MKLLNAATRWMFLCVLLIAKQAEIFKLHKKVLKYQLSSRRNILDTFTAEQRDSFGFLLIESGYVLD